MEKTYVVNSDYEGGCALYIRTTLAEAKQQVKVLLCAEDLTEFAQVTTRDVRKFEKLLGADKVREAHDFWVELQIAAEEDYVCGINIFDVSDDNGGVVVTEY